jgi:hypothetical protein
MRCILAIDPGTTQTAYAIWDGIRLAESAVLPNAEMLRLVRRGGVPEMACEMIASYGMAVGREVFETCVWIGRFVEAHEQAGGSVRLIYRKDVKLHLCQSLRAKDANIRQALVDRFGPPGTKKSPGPLYGAKSHIWAALAVGVYTLDTAGQAVA